MATGEPAPESILQSVGSKELRSQRRADRQGERRGGGQMIQSEGGQGIDIKKYQQRFPSCGAEKE